MKECFRCGITKDLQDFTHGRNECKSCRSVSREKYREKEKASSAMYRKEHPEIFTKEYRRKTNIKQYDKKRDVMIKRARDFYHEHKDDNSFMEKRRALSKIYTKTDSGKASGRRNADKYFERHPEIKEARYAIMRAVRKKEVVLPLTWQCQFCGLKNNIEKHHPDYNKPLEIIELCKRCHGLEHKLEKKFHVMAELRKAA